MCATPRLLALAFLLVTFFSGCASDELTGTTPDNLRPKVWLSVAPPGGSTAVYRVHVHWGGFDPDGTISHFEWAITNNETGVFVPADTTGADKWHATAVGDSIFAFSADELADSASIYTGEMRPYEFIQAHTFFIRAVDDRGARSKVVYRSFTARNLSPVISITIPRSVGVALVPPFIKVQWVGKDFVGAPDETLDPDSVRSIIVSARPFANRADLTLKYIRENPNAPEWTDWVAYDAPGDSGRSWTPPELLAFGLHVFAVQAKDEAGAVSPVFDTDKNVRTLLVRKSLSGPTLIVTNPFIGTVATATTNTVPTILDVAGGVPLSFTFAADASSYGGIVAGYRYGWDIIDINDPEEWEISFTPFIGSTATSSTHTFFFGSHTFHVEVIDGSGFKSRLPIVLNIVPFTMEHPLLVVDDWNEGNSPTSFFATNGAFPSDVEHDKFWENMVSEVTGFNPPIDMLPPRGERLEPLPITTVARYRAIIWNTKDSPFETDNPTLNTILKQTIQFGIVDNVLRMFIARGGKVLLCGDYAMATVVDRSIFPGGGLRSPKGPSYPFIYRYEMLADQDAPYEGQEVGVRGIGEKSFAYDDCCLNVVDLAYGVHRAKKRDYCGVAGVREDDRKDTGIRACFPVDDTYSFPRLELRPEVAGTGKFYEASKLSLQSEIYNPPYFEALCNFAAELSPQRQCYQPIFALECLDRSAAVFGAPTAFWSGTYADVPDAAGIAARSVVWGFSPVYFNPDQVKEALEIIMFDEWQLPRTPVSARVGRTDQ